MSKLGAILFLFSALSWGQSYTGSIRGTITDNTKAASAGSEGYGDRCRPQRRLFDRDRHLWPLHPADPAGGAVQVDGAGRRLRQGDPGSVHTGSAAAGDHGYRTQGRSGDHHGRSAEFHGPAEHHFGDARTGAGKSRDHEPADQRPKSADAGVAGAGHHRGDRRYELRLQRGSEQRLRSDAGRRRGQRHRTERRHHGGEVQRDRGRGGGVQGSDQLLQRRVRQFGRHDHQHGVEERYQPVARSRLLLPQRRRDECQ